MMDRPALPDPAAGYELGVDEVADLATEITAEKIRLIDCRERDEWDFNRLPDAGLMPLSSFTTMAELLVSEGRPVIIYCHHGMRSLHATEWLRGRGLAKAWSMRGGIHAWSKEIDPEVPTY